MARPATSPAVDSSVAPEPLTGRASTASLLVTSLRPEQWTKNLVVFAGALFGGRLLDPASVALAIATFLIFCALSGAVYLVNDWADRDADRRHPLKRTRPLASGQLSSAAALSAVIMLTAAALAGAFAINATLAITAAAYVALQVAYSLVLKHLVIVDALTIAGGFVLRATAGAVAIAVPISHWLLVCTTLLALFLAFSKRRHELTLLAQEATDHRRILEEYSPYLLDQMIGVVTASTLVAYAMYATSAETAARLGTTRLGVTIPFVLYGIFRYLYLVHRRQGGGSPAALLLTDRPLLACVALWAASVALILYSPLLTGTP